MKTFEVSDKIIRARRQRGGGCLNGTCGPYASLCSACHDEQLAEHRVWAAKEVKEAPAVGEDLGDWWQRVGGRFLDTWYEVASETAGRLILAIVY